MKVLSIIDTPSPNSGSCAQALLHRFQAGTEYIYLFITNSPEFFIDQPHHIIVESGSFRKNFSEITQIINESKPDIVETHSYKPHIVVGVFLLFAKIFFFNCNGMCDSHDAKWRWVFIEHGYTFGLKLLLYNKVAEALSIFAHRIYSPNTQLVRKFNRLGSEALFLPTVLPEDKKVPLVTRHLGSHSLMLSQHDKCQLDIIRIGYVGRLAIEKDPITLLRAVKTLKLLNTRFQVEIAGDGPLMKRAQSYVQQNALPVIFYGQYDISKLELDIVVLPSLSEGFPNILLEFSSIIITTPVGSIPEVLSDLPHFTFDPQNHLQLAEKLNRAIQLVVNKEARRFNINQALNRKYTLEHKLEALSYSEWRYV